MFTVTQKSVHKDCNHTLHVTLNLYVSIWFVCDFKIIIVIWQTKYVYSNIQAWYPRCQEAEQIDMTDDVKQAILDKHNELRNIQASGQTPGYPSAKRMATMVRISQLFSEKYLTRTNSTILKLN